MGYAPQSATLRKSFRKSLTALTLLAALCGASCSSSTTLTRHSVRTLTDTVTVRETEHDTIVVTEPDSALFWAWVRCDSLGNALIEQMAAEQGGRTTLAPRAETTGGRAVIRVRAETKPEGVIVRRREVGRVETRHTTAESATVGEPRRTLSVRLRATMDDIALLLVGMAIGYIIKTIRR